MEENMQSISLTFTLAARRRAAPQPVFSIYWMMVWAIAILDDADRREKDRRRKCEPAPAPTRPKPPGPR